MFYISGIMQHLSYSLLCLIGSSLGSGVTPVCELMPGPGHRASGLATPGGPHGLTVISGLGYCYYGPRQVAAFTFHYWRKVPGLYLPEKQFYLVNPLDGANCPVCLVSSLSPPLFSFILNHLASHCGPPGLS